MSEPSTPKRPTKGANMDPPKLPKSISKSVKDKRKYLQRTDASDSESDDDTISMSSSTFDYDSVKQQPRSGKSNKSAGEWVIVEGLKDGNKYGEKTPEKMDGYLLKRRKWPLKGWHKRYFSLEKGILSYAKSPSDIQKRKLHGEVDIGLSVLSYKQAGKRIDIDAEDVIYHLKVKSTRFFEEWIEKLRKHRLYRQHEIAYGSRDIPRLTEISSPGQELPGESGLPVFTTGDLMSPVERARGLSLKRGSSLKSRSSSMVQGQNRVAAWLIDTAGIEQCNKELQTAQAKIFDLTNVLAQMHDIQAKSDQIYELNDSDSQSKKGKNAKKSTRKGGKKDKYSKDDHILHSTIPGVSSSSSAASLSSQLSNSNPNLAVHENDKGRPISMPEYLGGKQSVNQRYREVELREEFLDTARNVSESLKSLVRTINTERDRLKNALEQEAGANIQGNNTYILSLREMLTEALKENTELRAKMAQIHAASDLSDFVSPRSTMDAEQAQTLLSQTLSMESTSIAEFFDAAEYLGSSASSSEASDDEGDETSELSEDENDTTPPESVTGSEFGSRCVTGRREKLPAPQTDAGNVSLWNLLCKNIGKDLSKMSMPVTLNEPLGMLQILCEELEYSDLLDKAVSVDNPYQRMVLVAAFAVSAYAASYYRAGQKPFNPLLGETYECVREDMGWKFVAEQVSHHPPISACYCESSQWKFWQDARIKTKFWGKSMEIHPVGTVHLSIPKYGDEYEWNKVTTCVHNILSGQRWVDQYGEMTITNGRIKCKLTFAKASYWSSKRHEVYGTVVNEDGKIVQYLFGKWTEGLYCGRAPSAKCIWRPGSMPEDYELYYGFTRFAVELNELDATMKQRLPPTDTRFRPDQRLLEEGRIQEAESEKLRVEGLQRERRKMREEQNIQYEAKWFKKAIDPMAGKECFKYTNEYWEKQQQDLGFSKETFPKLW